MYLHVSDISSMFITWLAWIIVSPQLTCFSMLLDRLEKWNRMEAEMSIKSILTRLALMPRKPLSVLDDRRSLRCFHCDVDGNGGRWGHFLCLQLWVKNGTCVWRSCSLSFLCVLCVSLSLSERKSSALGIPDFLFWRTDRQKPFTPADNQTPSVWQEMCVCVCMCSDDR